jgi:hypothetical protein
MSKNIKIIKRSERDANHKPTSGNRVADNKRARQQQHQQATRDIAGHVTTWIKEFQQRHTPDPRRAFAGLFVDPATSPAD